VLARHYRVVRRDLRGRGLSSCPGPDYDYSLDTVLGEIADTLDQLGLEKVHILGESTGGMIAVAFAGKFPDRCHSLITCATPTHLPESFQKEQAQGRKD
jgi:pimeloyl-ACP methyl ester carboxylesterase